MSKLYCMLSLKLQYLHSENLDIIFSLWQENVAKEILEHNIAGQMKQDKLFCITTAMDSLVLQQCSIQRKLTHCLVTITYILWTLLS